MSECNIYLNACHKNQLNCININGSTFDPDKLYEQNKNTCSYPFIYFLKNGQKSYFAWLGLIELRVALQHATGRNGG